MPSIDLTSLFVKDELQVFDMILFSFVIHQNIFDVYKDTLADQLSQDLINFSLKEIWSWPNLPRPQAFENNLPLNLAWSRSCSRLLNQRFLQCVAMGRHLF